MRTLKNIITKNNFNLGDNLLDKHRFCPPAFLFVLFLVRFFLFGSLDGGLLLLVLFR